jgi:hypothetical protein
MKAKIRHQEEGKIANDRESKARTEIRNDHFRS